MALIVTIGGHVIATNADHRVSANGLEYANAIGQRDTMTMVIESPNGSYRPEIGASISAVDAAIGLEFGGTIRALDTDQHGDGGLTHTIGCASWEQLFDRRTTGVYEYPAQRADLIVAALLANNMGGDNIGASILQTGPVIGPVTFDFISVRRALDAVCEYASSGEDTWVWDCPVISGVRTLRFYKQDTYPAPYDCTATNHNIKRPIHISYALDENYGNRVYVRMGEYIRDSEPQTFTATAGQTVFSCDYPLAGTPSVTVNGAPKTVGVRDVDTLKDCYWNLDSKDVEFVVPMTGGESIVVTYQGKDAKVFDAVNESSEIDARAAAEGDTTGYFVAVIDVSTAGGTSAAQAAADAWLAVHASIPSTVTYPSSAPGLRAGMYQTVNQPAFGINAAYVIKSVTLTRGNGRWLWNVSAVRGNLAGDWMAKLRKLAVGPAAAGVSIGAPPIPFTYGDTTIPSSFTFGVTASALDPTVAEISGLSFPSPSNHNSVSAGTFTFFYVDESATPAFLTGDVALGASSMDVDSATGLEGKYVEIDGEIVLCGTPSGSTVPITRAQLGSAADAHSTGAAVRLCMTVVQTVTFAAGFFSTAAAADWVLKCALPNQKLVAVTGSVTNAYGNSPLATVCLTANSAHGLRLDAPSSAGTAWTVVAPAVNADRTLSASDGDQIINVTATSRNCTITLPPETSMEGRHVTVNRAPGSTYNVYVAPGSTFTIDSSGSSKTLDDTGTQWSGVGAGSNNWITTSITGDFTVPATPDAPNVTGSSTFEVAYVDQDGADASNGGYMLPRGVFYLPTTDPNYAHLVAVDVRLVIEGAAPIVARFPGPWSGNTQAWRWPAPLPRPTSNGAVTAEYIAINDDGHASSSPVTFTAVTITGQPLAPLQATLVVFSEQGTRIPGPDLPGRAVMTGRATLTLPATGVPADRARVKLYDATNAERYGIIGTDVYQIVRPGGGALPYIEFPCYAPTINETWHVKVSTASATAENLWSTAVASAGVLITGLGLPAANLITSLDIGAGAGGNFPYNATRPDGSQYWLIPSASYNDSACTADANAFFNRVTVQACDASHTPCGPEQAWTGKSIVNGVFQCGPICGDYGTLGYGATFSQPIAYLRFRAYCCNRVDESPNAFANPACATPQTGIGNGAGYVDKLVAAGGATPAGAIPASRLTATGGQAPAAVVPTGPGLHTVNGQIVPYLDTPFTVVADKIALAQNGIGNQYLGASCVAAVNMALNSVTASNGALAALAVLDSNVAAVHIGKVIAGTVIFTGDVYMARGWGYPMMQLSYDAMYLWSAGWTSGSSQGETASAGGLTAYPYVAITGSLIGLYSGGNESVTLSSTALYLWSVNGNSSYPYVSLTSSEVLLRAGNFSTYLTASQIVMSYSAGVATTINSLGLKVLNGTYSVVVGSSWVQLYSVDGNSSYPYIGITSAAMYIGAGNYVTTFTASQIVMAYSGGASLTLNATGLTIQNGNYSLSATASSLTLAYSGGGSTVIGASSVTIYSVNGNASYPRVLIGSSTVHVFTAGADFNVTDSGWSLTISGAPKAAVTVDYSYTYLSILSGLFGQYFVHIEAGSSGSYININGWQVLGGRQTGLGSPSGWSDSTALAWAQSLYNKLSAHGLIV